MRRFGPKKQDDHPRVALVTGAGIRLGRAIAEALAEDGFDLLIHHNRSMEGARAVAEIAKASGRRARLVRADLTVEKQVRKLASQAERAFGRIDLLVNSAAIYHSTSRDDLAGGDLDAFWAVNARAPYLLSALLGEGMKRRGQGLIINIDCLSAERPWKDFLPYSISKAALRSCTLGFAQRLAPEVRVNGIAPGTVLPPPGTSAQQKRRFAEQALLKRLGSSEDIVKAVRYLVGANFVTGEILHVDGGRSWVRGGEDHT